MSEQPWGYNQHQVLYVPVPDYAAFEKLNALVERESGVISISGSQHHLGKGHKGIVVRMSDKQYEVSQLSVDAKYLETMGLQLLAGRGFIENSVNDKNTVVVNESFVKNVASNPVGQTFRIDSVQYEVIGIVKDFHAYSFTKKVVPTILKLADKKDYQYLSVKVEQDARPEMLQKLQTLWTKLYPETPFNGGYQEDVWGSYYGQLDIFASVWKSFATIAILLAGLGLYGLVSVNVAGRVKEFSIRKILGAGISSIAGSIGKQYVLLFVIALSIGAPISYALNKFMFDFFFWYHMPITYTGVVIAILILIFVLLMTVSTQIGKVFKSNPVEGLKTE
jgi:putative ABC transport system permease protein